MAGYRPRVLILCSTFPRWRGDNVPDFVERLTARLGENFRIILVAPHYEGAQKVERWKNFVVLRYRYFLPDAGQKLAYGGGIMPNIWRAPWLIVQLPFLLLFGALTCRRLLATRMFDLVHAHWIIPQGIQLRLAAIAMRRAPCIVTSHGGDLWTLRGKLGRQLKIWTLRRCESITVVSKAMQPIAAGLAPNAAIDVIPMGTEMNVFYPPATPAPLLRLLFAGRLSEKKGVETAIRAIAMLRDLPNLHLTVAGDGPLRKSLEQLVHDLDVNDKITFAGWQDRNRLAELLRMHGVFVFPSVITRSGDQEGLGLTLAEAMATGCSVIASDLPAVRDLVIDEKTGYTFPPGDHVALAARIRAIQNDAATARQVATAARQHVERKFSMEHSAEQFCKLYNSLIENNTSA